MRASSCRQAGWAVAIAILPVTGSAWGAAPTGSIDVFVVGSQTPVSRLEGALAAVDRPLHWVELETMDLAQVTQPPRAQGAEARVWVDCSSPGRVRLYFANRSAERFLLREVPIRDGLDALSLETIAQMIESSLSMLISDRDAGLTRAEMSAALGEHPPAAVSAAPSPSPSPLDVSFGVFYAAQAFAQDWPVEHGPGISAAVGRRHGRLRPGAWMTGQFQLPETIDTGLAGVRIDTFALRAGAELGMPVSEDATLVVRVGAGGDVLHVVPREGTTTMATLAQERFYWDSMTQLSIVANVRLTRELVLFGALLVDLDLLLRHYDVEMDRTTVRFATPWRVRPGLMAGLAWH